MTADDLMTLPGDDGLHELVRGALRVNPPPGARHGQVGTRVLVRLALAVESSALGAVFGADTGFLLSRDPDTVRAPDVSFVRADRVPTGRMPDGYIEGGPDLAVEVLSPSDTMLDMEEKVEEYLAAGTRLVWVIDPRLGRVTEHALHATPRILGVDDMLDGGDVLPGFRCSVREIVA